MAPKKKTKTAPRPLACFEGLKITVIGANPIQRPLWEAKIGAGAAFLKPSQAASLKEGNDFVVIAAEGVNPATVRANAGAAQLVGWRWLTDSIGREALQSAEQHAWSPAVEAPQEPPQQAPQESKKVSVQLIIDGPDAALQNVVSTIKERMTSQYTSEQLGEKPSLDHISLTSSGGIKLPLDVLKSNIERRGQVPLKFQNVQFAKPLTLDAPVFALSLTQTSCSNISENIAEHLLKLDDRFELKRHENVGPGALMLTLFIPKMGATDKNSRVVEQMKQALSDANITDYGSAKAVSIVVKTKDGETFPLTQSGSNDNAPSA